MAGTKWETVMGLEVHAELSTKSKIFCGCSTAFGAAPNTNVCPGCAGMPGTLPKLNREVVEYAIKLGLALNCEINTLCKFDRKNYTYPDLPKAYQVSQLYAPICRNGHLDIEVGDGQQKTIRIHQIHMEEDAGKLVHNPRGGQTFMDFNRGGVPLLEIVTEPDFRSAEEVVAYLEKLRETLLYLDICDCKMQEGSLRADVNLSIRPVGGELGVRAEMKNLNSFKAINRAIAYESNRHIEVLEDGGQLIQETRRWDDDLGESFGMRSKANAQDYRYFPDPDIPPVSIDDAWLARVKENMPELAHQKRERYISEYGLTSADASILTGHKNLSDLFEKISEKSGEPKESANLILGEIMRLMNQTNTLPEDLTLDESKLVTLIGLVLGGKINRNAYKETIEVVFLNDANPEAYISEKGLMMVSDSGAIAALVEAVIADNPSAIEDYKAGKQKAFGFLIGQVMKQLGGSGNPGMVKKVLIEKLGGK
ncbi:MAG: Asp-tRNA(Asn)/Glu-tRNA(Gln) amidotransferase subunit GatB [Defluviitaleaceae bacterium]|nr:Asp-tRNA(Asn)/Glu-tRNA(Gln) amidotransferase subunit GatB [Defluviitaleaceae bacterium]